VKKEESYRRQAFYRFNLVQKCYPVSLTIEHRLEAGLRRRREEEADLFCTPSSSSTTTVSKENTVPNYSDETNGHCQVELAYGLGVWYVYQKHWELPWEDHKDDHDNQELFGDLKLGNDLASRIIKYMKTKDYKVFTNPKEYNIVYIEVPLIVFD
jgi:hypothetical protein